MRDRTLELERENAALRRELAQALLLFEDLRDREAAFRHLFENASDLLYTHDLRGRFTAVNQAMVKSTGYSKEELLQLNIAELSAPDSGSKIDVVGMNGPPAAIQEVEFVRKDGTRIALELATKRMLKNGRPFGVQGIARDVTMQRAVKAQLVLRERMASLGMVAASVAHEVNNPLTFVTSNLGFIHERLTSLGLELGDPRLEELRAALGDALTGAARVTQVVRELSALSRPGSDEPKPISIREVLELSLNMTKKQLMGRAQVEKSFHETRLVLGNESKLGQVFINLLVNAAQALPEEPATGHQISIRTCDLEDDRVLIEIADTGTGIPEADRERIFAPFFTTKEADTGTGLGLYICRNIIHELGGSIEVTDAPGGGACFRVVLRAGARPAPHVDSRLPHAAGSEVEVLVLDDDPLILRSVERGLTGTRVTSVTDPLQALALLRERRFDLVLVDLMMPDVTGADFYRQVRDELPGKEQSIVIMTGGSFTPESDEFLASFAPPVLSKPFDRRALRDLVTELTQPSPTSGVPGPASQRRR